MIRETIRDFVYWLRVESKVFLFTLIGFICFGFIFLLHVGHFLLGVTVDTLVSWNVIAFNVDLIILVMVSYLALDLLTYFIAAAGAILFILAIVVYLFKKIEEWLI